MSQCDKCLRVKEASDSYWTECLCCDSKDQRKSKATSWQFGKIKSCRNHLFLMKVISGTLWPSETLDWDVVKVIERVPFLGDSDCLSKTETQVLVIVLAVEIIVAILTVPLTSTSTAILTSWWRRRLRFFGTISRVFQIFAVWNWDTQRKPPFSRSQRGSN